MTRKEWCGEILTYALIVVFAFGWIDFGQGPGLTWWALIAN